MRKRETQWDSSQSETNSEFQLDLNQLMNSRASNKTIRKEQQSIPNSGELKLDFNEMKRRKNGAMNQEEFRLNLNDNKQVSSTKVGFFLDFNTLNLTF